MLTSTLITTFAAALLSGALALQETTPAPKSLSRVFGSAPQEPLKSGDTLDTWRVRLADADLSLREQHFERLIEAARGDPKLQAALAEWAADSANGELAWTARLALRELASGPYSWLGLRGTAHPYFALPFDFDSPFDAERWLDELDSSWRRFDPSATIPAPQAPGSGQSSAESFSLRLAPDGVKVEVQRNVDGKEEVQTYEAESLEQLLEAHPELRGKLEVGGQAFSEDGLGNALRRWGLRVIPRRSDATSPFGRADAGVRTDILGVVVQPLSTDAAQSAGQDPIVGLRIERVEPGTIASSMGLQRGHVLIELNGNPIRTRDDITNELKKRAADAALEAVVIDRWGQKRAHTWKPDTARQL